MAEHTIQKWVETVVKQMKFPPDRKYVRQELWDHLLDSRDCRVERGHNGLVIEIVCFAGEKLPKLPPAAVRLVRPWNPNVDEPFFYSPTLKNAEK